MKVNADSGMKPNSFRPTPEPRSACRNSFHKQTALDNTMAGSLPKKGRISLPARRLSVRKIKEVLRLKFSVGLGLRQVARSSRLGWEP